MFAFVFAEKHFFKWRRVKCVFIKAFLIPGIYYYYVFIVLSNIDPPLLFGIQLYVSILICKYITV